MEVVKNWLTALIISLVFISLHLVRITALPVFADESIYIRWAQLIQDEPARYAFFALNDGKTPLFIWLLVPFQLLIADPLVAGRAVAVAAGLIQLAASVWVTRLLGGKFWAQLFVTIFVTILPFWFFHHQMALMDGLLTAFCTVAFGAVLKATQTTNRWKWSILAGVAYGVALWTKLPAVLFAPALLLPVFSAWLKQKKAIPLRELKLSSVLFGISFVIFGLLALTPNFGQLFSRGSDFLFPWQEVVFEGRWRETLPNFPTYGWYFLQYLTPAVLLVPASLVFSKRRSLHLQLLIASLFFILPIALLGKMVFPRYFLPGAILLTISMALALEELIQTAQFSKIWKSGTFTVDRLLAVGAVACIVGSVAITSARFITPQLTQPDATPFVSSDRVQYLTEWSSGHGVKEAVELIEERANTTTIAVATEGFFGTLPDAPLMYLHGKQQENIWLEGVGQPVTALTDSFLPHAEEAQEVWLLVNSHRFPSVFPGARLIAQYCRPYQAPCLQVWDITEYAHQEAAEAAAPALEASDKQ